MSNGSEAAHFSVGTDESYTDPNTNKRVKHIEWHRVVTFSPAMLTYLETHGQKGKLVYVAGKLQTRQWKKNGNTRYSTKILLVPDGTVRFLDEQPKKPAVPEEPVPTNLELF